MSVKLPADKKLSKVIGGRFTAAEIAQLDILRKKRGCTMSTLVRELCMYGLQEAILKEMYEDLCQQFPNLH